MNFAHDQASCLIPVSPDRQAKARQKMTALVDAIQRFHTARGKVQGKPIVGGSLEIEDLHTVLNAVDDALVAIRTLDLEVFTASDKTAYEAMLSKSPEGKVVRGLVGPRNNAVHGAEVVDPCVSRAVGPLLDGRYLIWPRWKNRSDVPTSVFGRTAPGAIGAYDQCVAGRPVIETLIDAFTFFATCDPCTPQRDEAGNWFGFPLQPLSVPGYERLAPDWPNRKEADAQVRADCTAVPPGGDGREIRAVIEVDGQRILCGYTRNGYRQDSFTEPVEQVVRDIERGYSYSVATADGSLDVSVVHDDLEANGKALSDLKLAAPSGDITPPWEGWWQLCQDDAAYYRAQRNPR